MDTLKFCSQFQFWLWPWLIDSVIVIVKLWRITPQSFQLFPIYHNSHFIQFVQLCKLIAIVPITLHIWVWFFYILLMSLILELSYTKYIPHISYRSVPQQDWWCVADQIIITTYNNITFSNFYHENKDRYFI